MNHIFDLKISPYTGTAEVLLDAQALSSQSQLRVCNIDSVRKWYKDLPELLYAELNDDYILHLHCREIEYVMLSAVFVNHRECLKIVYKPVSCKYDTKTRCRWLWEAAADLGIKLPELPLFSVLSSSDASVYKDVITGKLDSFIKNLCIDCPQQINVILATGRTFEESKSLASSENDLIFVIDHAGSGISTEQGVCLAVRGNQDKVAALLQEWIDLNLFTPFIMYGYTLLSTSGKTPNFYVKARLQMLTQEEPVVESRMPSRLECGHETAILLDEFPSTVLKARSNNSSVAEIRNGRVRAVKSGSARIEIFSESGKMVCEHLLSVYFVPRVTAITLSRRGGNKVLEGERFQISVVYTPSNAVDISHTVWTVSPTGALKSLGGGRFEALGSGTCTVTVHVGSISQSLTLEIIPLPKDIQMPSEIRIKLKGQPVIFHASLEPAGSGCRSLHVRILDTGVARWDQTVKTITAVSEGNTFLEVSAEDSAGNTVLRRKCEIRILPEKDVITPPTLLTLILVCVILMTITGGTYMAPLAALCGLAISIVEVFQNLNPLLKKSYSQKNIIELVTGVTGVVVFIAAMGYYMDMI